jgi:hypothetical protein
MSRYHGHDPFMPRGPALAELLCSMDMEPLVLGVTWPRVYPTNYFDEYVVRSFRPLRRIDAFNWVEVDL